MTIAFKIEHGKSGKNLTHQHPVCGVKEKTNAIMKSIETLKTLVMSLKYMRMKLSTYIHISSPECWAK
jgi:hypothetical protein